MVSSHQPGDPNERMARRIIYGIAAILMLAFLLGIAWKFRDAMLDQEDRAACRRRGGDVIYSPDRSQFARQVDEWRCVATTPGRAP